MNNSDICFGHNTDYWQHFVANALDEIQNYKDCQIAQKFASHSEISKFNAATYDIHKYLSNHYPNQPTDAILKLGTIIGAWYYNSSEKEAADQILHLRSLEMQSAIVIQYVWNEAVVKDQMARLAESSETNTIPQHSTSQYAVPCLILPTGISDRRKPCALRDHTWLKWRIEEGLKQADIRDRWNAMADAERMAISPQHSKRIERGQHGCDTVKKGLLRAEKEKNN